MKTQKNRKKTPKRKPKHTVDKNFGIELKNSIKAKKKSNLNLLCISSLWQNLPKQHATLEGIQPTEHCFLRMVTLE